MRFHERCPKCGYTEEKNWRPRLMDIECDIIEADEIPDLKKRLLEENPLVEHGFAYHLTKSQKWIERLLETIWKARGCRFTRYPNQYARSARARQISTVNVNLAARRKQAKLFPEKEAHLK